MFVRTVVILPSARLWGTRGEVPLEKSTEGKAGIVLPRERRRNRRFRADRGVQCWKLGDTVARWGKLSDISLGGCYVKIIVPFAVATEVRVQLMLFGKKVLAEGVVRTSVAGRGMGIEFCRLPKDNASKLQAALEQLCNSGLVAVLDPAALALTKVQEWFAVHENLSRETFFRLRKSGQGALESSGTQKPLLPFGRRWKLFTPTERESATS